MRLVTEKTNVEDTLPLAVNLRGTYEKPVLFHAFWHGTLNEKHVASVKSCYLFNIKNQVNRKIIVWVENTIENEHYTAIQKYAEVRQFNLKEGEVGTPFEGKAYYYKKQLATYSDVIRCMLLYKYGGCWFDLDILFLRDFGPIFHAYEEEVMVYQWERQVFPNQAIFISLKPEAPVLKELIEFFMKRNKGCAFIDYERNRDHVTYKAELNLYVLPCSWFDIEWVSRGKFEELFEESVESVRLESFHPGAFAYHWHNRWNTSVHPSSPFAQLSSQISSLLDQ